MNRSNIFLIFCIPCRCILAYLASILPDNNLKIMGYIYGLMSIGFMYAFINNMQNTPEFKEIYGGIIYALYLR